MKGFTQTLEAVIGVVIIIGVMLFLFSPVNIQEQDIHETAYSCLKYAKDFEDFDVKLNECLPGTYQYQYRICEEISCSATLPENKTITAVDYINSGPEIIKVWVFK